MNASDLPFSKVSFVTRYSDSITTIIRSSIVEPFDFHRRYQIPGRTRLPEVPVIKHRHQILSHGNLRLQALRELLGNELGGQSLRLRDQ